LKQYVDSSVIVRVVLNAGDALPEWETLRDASSSVLLQVECLRTMDRLQFTGDIKEPNVPVTYSALHDVMSKISLLKLGDDIFERASGSFGLPLKTLDAIHLVTAITWRERINDDITFVTHDIQLAAAARAYHFPVLGVTLGA
jgi:predicted nucleic acid-binding protein